MDDLIDASLQILLRVARQLSDFAFMIAMYDFHLIYTPALFIAIRDDIPRGPLRW